MRILSVLFALHRFYYYYWLLINALKELIMNTRSPNRTFTLCLLFIFCLGFSTIAQVGIGTTSPNADALLDVDASSTSGGILLPRLALTSTNSPSPLSTDVAGMIVYNTATVGDVIPGFYFNDGSDWIKIYEGDDWRTTGNAGTSPGTNYIGTSDSQNLIFKTNGSENMRILTDGRIAINETSPAAGDLLTVTGNSGDYAINGYGSGGGVGVYGEDSGGGIGVYGNTGSTGYGVYGVNNSTGRGVYGVNTSTGYGVYGGNNNSGQGVRGYNSGTGYGIFARSANSSGKALGVNNTTTSGTALISAGNNGALYNFTGSGGTFNGSLGVVGLTTSATGTGISGIGNAGTTSNTLTAGSGIAGSGNTGVYGKSTSSTGTGIIGVGNNNGTITTHSRGSGISGSADTIGVFGYAGNGDDNSANYGNAGAEFVLDGDNDPTTNSNNSESNRARAILAGFDNVAPFGAPHGTRESYFGGYFSGGNENGSSQTYAYVGMRYRIGNNGTSGGNTTDYKIIGTGSVSTLIKDQEGNHRTLFAPEAPEVLFQDFGVGTLINGVAKIDIDPILKNGIFVDSQHPLKVYVTLEGDCNGIYVTNKSIDGFTVKELQGGTSNVSFSWQLVANRIDTKDSNGKIISKHVGVRFPEGPGPLKADVNKNETSKKSVNTVTGDTLENENSFVNINKRNIRKNN